MLLGCSTPEQRAVAAQILQERIGVQPSADQQALMWLNDETGVVEWVVGYNAFIGKTCQMHVVNMEGKTTPRKLIWAAFDYPFNQAGREVVFGVLNSENPRAVEYDKKLGFKEVHRIPGVHDDGGDIVLLQMNKADCRWIKERKNAL